MNLQALLASNAFVWGLWGAITLLYGYLLARTLRATSGLPIRTPGVMLLVFLFFLNWYLGERTFSLWMGVDSLGWPADEDLSWISGSVMLLSQRLVLTSLLSVVFRIPGHRALWGILAADRRLIPFVVSTLGLAWAGWTLLLGS